MSSETPIQAVLFDYGLVLSGPPDPVAWAHMREITGLDEAAYHRAYWAPRHAYDRGTHTGEGYWLEVGRNAGMSFAPEQIAGLIDADTRLWTQLNQPMVDWAFRLQAAGIRTGILSNIGDAMEAGIVGRFDWLQSFDFRLWSHRLKLAKPELEIYRHAADGLMTPPPEILFVDDRPENIAGAMAAGMQAIQYVGTPDFVAELASRGLGYLWQPGATSG